MLVICLYAIQSIYSADVAFAARNVGFFLVPFAVLFCLLAMAPWDRRLLRLAFGVLLVEGVILAGIGIGQFATEHIFWNGKLEASNDFHFYFRVNSLFWDPNIYGRYLMVGILLGAAALLWTADRRFAFALIGALAITFAGLVFAFSRTHLHRPVRGAGRARRAALERTLGRNRDSGCGRRDRDRRSLRRGGSNENARDISGRATAA